MKRFLQGALKVFLFFFIFFSIAPYVIPTGADMYQAEDLATESSRFVTVEDIRIHYHFYPAAFPEGTVVFVHGFGGSLFSFLNNVDSLVNANYSVVLIDLPGFGLSQRGLNADYSNSGRAELLIEIAEKLQLTTPLHWVGHSMGGSILSWVPDLDPSYTKSVTLVAAPYDSESPALLQKLVLSYPPVLKYLEVLWPRFVTEKRVGSLLSTAYGRALDQNEIDGYLKPLLVEKTHLTLVGLIRDRSAESPPLSSDSIPFLIIWGSADTWVPIEQAEPWKTSLPSIRMATIPEAGHNPMETHTARFNEILLSFLSSLQE